MNEIEALVQKEKDTSYNQRNKDLFTFYTLILINQEESKRRQKNRLIVFGLISIAPALILMFNIESIINSLLNLVLNLSLPLLYNPSYSYLVCILLTGFMFSIKRKSFFNWLELFKMLLVKHLINHLLTRRK